MKRNLIKDINNLKKIRPIVCLTAYTSSIAKIIDKHSDIILVGDSVGTVIYGMKNTQLVNLEMMKNHGKAVYDNSKKAFTIIDMPYSTYKNKKEALNNAKILINYTNCQSVKLECNNQTVKIVNHLAKNRINVVSHIGVTPQSFKDFSTIRSIGRKAEDKKRMIKLALDLENSGTSMIVLECLTADLAKEISNRIQIPTIGIGSSVNCDGQVLVIDDILNYDNSFKKPKFIKSYTNLSLEINQAVKKFTKEVINKKFPSRRYSYK
jgi:3-methyl-2-oxobutanoate hydroxymethyltransferase